MSPTSLSFITEGSSRLGPLRVKVLTRVPHLEPNRGTGRQADGHRGRLKGEPYRSHRRTAGTLRGTGQQCILGTLRPRRTQRCTPSAGLSPGPCKAEHSKKKADHVTAGILKNKEFKEEKTLQFYREIPGAEPKGNEATLQGQ